MIRSTTGLQRGKKQPRWELERCGRHPPRSALGQHQRPFIMVGGELTLAGLDLVYDDVLKYYEAPFQLKANGVFY
jgi:hypothetical protein